MHTKSLATLRQGHVRRQLGKAAKEAGKVNHTAADRQAAINGQATSAPSDGRAETAGQPANGGVNGHATNCLGVGGGGRGAYAVRTIRCYHSFSICYVVKHL